VDMFFRIAQELEMASWYGKTSVSESKPINNYLLNIGWVSLQYKKDWIKFQLKKRYSTTRNRIIYGYNLSMKTIWNNGI